MWAIFTFTFVYMDNVDVSLNKPQTAESCEPKDNKTKSKIQHDCPLTVNTFSSLPLFCLILYFTVLHCCHADDTALATINQRAIGRAHTSAVISKRDITVLLATRSISVLLSRA